MTEWIETAYDGWVRFEPNVGKVTVSWKVLNGQEAWYLADETLCLLVPLSFFKGMGAKNISPLNTADDILRCLKKQREYENWINK